MIKGVHFVPVKREGKSLRWYVYAWRGGPLVLKAESPTKPKLGPKELKLIADALAEAQQPLIHTLQSVICDWKRSPEWAALAPGTRKTWGSQLKAVEAEFGKTPIGAWSDGRMARDIMDWRDKRKDTPRAADIGVTVLREVLKFALYRRLVNVNVAMNIPTLYRTGERAEIIWTDDDIERFEAKAIEEGRPWLIDGLRLAAMTGLRRQDLVALTWKQVGEFAIVRKALKRSKRRRKFATMPRIPALDGLLKELETRPRKPGVETVLVNGFGRPWSGDGFGGSFNRIRDAAGIVHTDEETGKEVKKHLHDVRGTFATRLMTATDLTDQEVADIMGWAPERVHAIRKVYVDQSAVVVALGERLRHIAVKRGVKGSEG